MKSFSESKKLGKKPLTIPVEDSMKEAPGSALEVIIPVQRPTEELDQKVPVLDHESRPSEAGERRSEMSKDR